MYYESIRPATELLVIGYENNGETRGYAMRKLLGTRTPESADVTDFCREGGFTKFFRKALSRGPWSLRIADNEDIQVIDYSSR